MGELFKCKARKGCCLPIYHKGKKVKVGDAKAVEISKKDLAYESLAELKRAINKKDIILVK